MGPLMIERTKVEGREAMVAYMDEDWNPVDDKADAALIKIIFDDGEIRFAVPAKSEDDENESGIEDENESGPVDKSENNGDNSE
jgi:hypothetical protein